MTDNADAAYELVTPIFQVATDFLNLANYVNTLNSDFQTLDTLFNSV